MSIPRNYLGVNLKHLAPFRFKEFESSILITNDMGRFLFLTRNEFDALVRNKLSSDSELYKKLKDNFFLAQDLDEIEAARAYRDKNHYLFNGPYLHIVIVTLRCNEICVYCHASRRNEAEVQFDMTEEIARKVVDNVFQSPSPMITIEFQGGEPLLNWPVVEFILRYAVERNRGVGKQLQFSLVTNLSRMDEQKLAVLMDYNVQICTSIDGHREIHDANRKLPGASAFDETVKWMKRADQAYKAKGLDPNLYHVEALLTVTRETLKYPKKVVDTYVELGRKAIFLRPLNPFGFAKKLYKKVGYTAEEFLDFYTKAVDYMIELNKNGVEILERFAAIVLTKMLTPTDPDYLDLRSPCGAGIGQIAYNYDGTVFTCDEGRMVYQMGDDMFLIGKIPDNGYRDFIESETVKALAIASCLETQPGCFECVYKPYCGVCPVYNYTEQGGIFGQQTTNERCKIYYGIINHFFEKIEKKGEEVLDILSKWAIVKDRRMFFMHE